ncbi:hypothetical protein JCM10207_009305 [Rhodosporidiobolus poonsookiae]
MRPALVLLALPTLALAAPVRLLPASNNAVTKRDTPCTDALFDLECVSTASSSAEVNKTNDEGLFDLERRDQAEKREELVEVEVEGFFDAE